MTVYAVVQENDGLVDVEVFTTEEAARTALQLLKSTVEWEPELDDEWEDGWSIADGPTVRIIETALREFCPETVSVIR